MNASRKIHAPIAVAKTIAAARMVRLSMGMSAPLDFSHYQIVSHERLLVVGVISRPGRRALSAGVTFALCLNQSFKRGSPFWIERVVFNGHDEPPRVILFWRVRAFPPPNHVLANS